MTLQRTRRAWQFWQAFFARGRYLVGFSRVVFIIVAVKSTFWNHLNAPLVRRSPGCCMRPETNALNVVFALKLLIYVDLRELDRTFMWRPLFMTGLASVVWRDRLFA